MTTKRKPAQQAAAKEKQEAFRTLAMQLSGELKEGKHTERLARVAEETPGIERYSPLNQLLILSQCPHATETHGFVEWRQLGYQVRKGEHGIAIRAPHTRPQQAQAAEGESAAGVGFHRIYVFDRSQVDPINTTQEGQESQAQEQPEAPTAEEAQEAEATSI